jgi:hypothetical protein
MTLGLCLHLNVSAIRELQIDNQLGVIALFIGADFGVYFNTVSDPGLERVNIMHCRSPSSESDGPGIMRYEYCTVQLQRAATLSKTQGTERMGTRSQLSATSISNRLCNLEQWTQ